MRRNEATAMSSTGFISGWVCGSAPVIFSRSSTSRVAPLTMKLVGHEKLEVIFDGGEFEAAKFHLDFVIEADTSKALRKRSIVSVKARANFSGFRKGTIPPFILKDINEFVLREAIGDEINAACDELNLKPLDGEASNPDLDFKELYTRFTVGQDYAFGCDIALRSATATTDSSSDVEPEAVEEDVVSVDAGSVSA
jgi:hypothetical protein